MRVLLDHPPFAAPVQDFTKVRWPANWIAPPGPLPETFVWAARLRFAWQGGAPLLHVSADERYELFLDGARIGRGPERGVPTDWFFESYRLDLAPGEHELLALVWTLGDLAPCAQESVHPGFLLAPDDPEQVPLLGTGVAPWQVRSLPGHAFGPPRWLVGARQLVDAARYDWDRLRDGADVSDWAPPVVGPAGCNREGAQSHGGDHLLSPAGLPAMLDDPCRLGHVRHVDDATVAAQARVDADHDRPDEHQPWQNLLRGDGAVAVPPETARRVIVDLGDYYCLYPVLRWSGGAGATIELRAAEALFAEPQPSSEHKTQRDQVHGLYFLGWGDRIQADGSHDRRFEPLWWLAGRYLELTVETAAEGLLLSDLCFRETRYPLTWQTAFAPGIPGLAEIAPIMFRTLQMCSHETYFDCPYYEQLMYVGDTRLEVLTTYVTTADDRLPRKALRLFATGRQANGLTWSRIPSREHQVIPPFSLWWVAMLHDFACWRADRPFVRGLLPAMRGILDHFLACLGDDGLLRGPQGWNFVDWVRGRPGWACGNPPDGPEGPSGILNWQLVYALHGAAEVEDWAGEPELTARWRRHAVELAARADAAYWHEGRGLYANNLAGDSFSEHAQCLALLSGHLPSARREPLLAGLAAAADLDRTTIYFSHYLLEAFREARRPDLLHQRLQEWYELKAQGFKTTREAPEPSRSDCHAWGAHPIYHYYHSLLGIAPGGPGFESVRIAPLVDGQDRAAGSVPHPGGGEIAVAWEPQGDNRRFTIDLPPGLTGELVLPDRTVALAPGRHEVSA